MMSLIECSSWMKAMMRIEPCLYGVAGAGISAAAWSRDGRRIFVGQQDGGVCIFAIDA